ncbi:MAG: carbohydrate binding domain-containing protein [Phycisphaeraceae bacterium JB051]
MKRTVMYLSLFLTLALTSLTFAQTDNDWFDFCPPWDDATPGTITDMSHLNAKPAGKNGYIQTKGDIFIESQTGNRIRFLATNTTAWHCFPDKATAEKGAARMAKFGINLVRLHHMDNRWSIESGSSLFKLDDKGALTIDPEQRDKLDYFVAQLKKNGIYVNINLKVSKVVSAADGFPEAIKDLGKFKYHKRVDRFDRLMIEHQKKFAHDLLSHVNPYTKLSYANDPAVAVVEINNENGLLGFTWGTIGAGLEKLPQPYLGDLQKRWNQWLKAKYNTDARLTHAWQDDMPIQSDPVFDPKSKWDFRTQGAAKGKLNQSANEPMHIAISKADGKSYHVELHRPNIHIQDDYSYVLSFKAKAASPRQISVSIMRDREDYRSAGLLKNIKLNTDWQDYEITFQGYKVDPGHTRLTFKMGQTDSDIWLDDVAITPGSKGIGLLDGESLAKANVHIPTAFSDQQRKDWLSFLVDLEAQFAREMRSYLKDDLGVKAMIIDSQINWGGMAGYEREKHMDYADVHTYWQHPRFPGKSWDRGNWTIENSSLINTWAQGKTGTLDKLAILRMMDRPYSVSEYDHSAPSEYNSECMPLLATVAATQDWDAIYSFEYGPWDKAKDQNRISQFFDHGSHPAKITFYPAAAVIFREGALNPIPSEGVLQLADQAFLQADRVQDAWRQTDASLKAKDVLSKRMGMQYATSPSQTKMRYDEMVPARLTTGEPQIRNVDGGGIFTAFSDHASVIAGQIGGQTTQSGAVQIQCPTFEKNFGTLTLTAMDQNKIANSKSLLLTAVAQGRNQNMIWNEHHNSLSKNWGNGPTQVLAVPGKVTIQTTQIKKVYALDQTGKRDHEVALKREGSAITFDISGEHKTVWYELTD